MKDTNTSAAIALAGLAVEYCRLATDCGNMSQRELLRGVLRYLPRFYVTISELAPYGEGPDSDIDPTGAIYDTVSEDQYEAVRTDLEHALGQHDMYLDTPADQMQYSDTPVAVSLAEKLADIYQNVADYAATVAQSDPALLPDIAADIRSRFAEFLSDTICSAQRAANYILYHEELDTE